jgi:hypothetical protein
MKNPISKWPLSQGAEVINRLLNSSKIKLSSKIKKSAKLYDLKTVTFNGDLNPDFAVLTDQELW